MAEQKRPSFFSSIVDGIAGYGKGFFGGGALGIAMGAIVGLLALPTFLATVVAFGLTFAAIGGIAGIVTGVVKGREINQPDPQDIAQVAHKFFAQGVAVGHKATLEQVEETNKFRDKILAERDQAQATQKTLH